MKYIVTAQLTISISTDVEASSPREAKQLALERPIMSLCYQCARGEPGEEWVTSGELDGAPTRLSVEVAGTRQIEL
jgi:hypothetical protein